MSTRYRLVQSGKTASGGCSAGQGSSEPVGPRIYLFYLLLLRQLNKMYMMDLNYKIGYGRKVIILYILLESDNCLDQGGERETTKMVWRQGHGSGG
jgi:hypothetical protein